MFIVENQLLYYNIDHILFLFKKSFIKLYHEQQSELLSNFTSRISLSYIALHIYFQAIFEYSPECTNVHTTLFKNLQNWAE